MVAHTADEREQAEKRVTRLASEAADLKELIQRIEEERRARAEAAAREREARAKAKQSPKSGKTETARAESRSALPHYEGPGKPFSQAKGQVPLPARGEIITRFGETDTLGGISKGISIETRPGAQVVAPYEGQVVYAGTFRSYGRLLIIEHGEGYLTLIAGLGRIEAQAGQTVVAGEPVGVMGDGSGKPILYVELRRNGQPVNPSPWLTALKDKVSG
jgi:septal ring factor EnvC (AmiA/AmiB activator)